MLFSLMNLCFNLCMSEDSRSLKVLFFVHTIASFASFVKRCHILTLKSHFMLILFNSNLILSFSSAFWERISYFSSNGNSISHFYVKLFMTFSF